MSKKHVSPCGKQFFYFRVILSIVMAVTVSLRRPYASSICSIFRRYPTKTITDADYADDIALLANTPTQAESSLHHLEQTAGGISLHMKAKNPGVHEF